MDYFYAFIWFALAVILFVKYRKENKIFVLLSAYFLFMGVWWVADAYMVDIDLMQGTSVFIFRVIAAIMLAISTALYVKSSKKK